MDQSLRLFFSYGHDANAPLVRLFRDRLAARGATVWMDEREIRTGDDWRDAILKGLGGAPRLVVFLSRHAIRPGSVCLEEIAFALHHLKGQILPVLVEAGIEAELPVSLTATQWLDLSDWQARQAEGEPAFTAWLDAQEAELWRVLNDPDRERFQGEIETLHQRLFQRDVTAGHALLSPWGRGLRIGRLLDGFVGREWLRDKVNAWRIGDPESRLLWLSGPPGMGKSAFAAWLTHQGQARVVALNLAEFNDAATRDTHRVIRTIALQVAAREPGYRRSLLASLPEGAVLPSALGELFRSLILDPLGPGLDGGRAGDPLLIVLDGLDETMDGERCLLAEILAECAQNLPAWVNILVTSRHLPAIQRQLGGYRPVLLEPDAADNRKDLELYARGWLKGDAPGGTTLPDAVLEDRIRQVTRAAAGNMLYLRVLRDAVKRGLLTLDTLDAPPPDLPRLYEAWLRRVFREPEADQPHWPSPRDYRPEFGTLLAVLCCAETPVPQPVLEAALGLDEWTLDDRLRAVAGLFERRGAGWAPFHKSLRDWLLGEGAGPWRLLERAGWDALAPLLWRGLAAPDDFVLAEFPRFVAARGAKLAEDVEERGGIGLLHRVGFQADALSAAHLNEAASRWWLAMARLAKVSEPRAAARNLEIIAGAKADDLLFGRLLASDDALTEARANFSSVFLKAAAAPSNIFLQDSLSRNHSRIGDVLMARGESSAAVAEFRCAKDISMRLAEAHPTKPYWLRNLCVGHSKLGAALQAEGKGSEARAEFRASVAIMKHLVATNPTDSSLQADLCSLHCRMGVLLQAQGEGAVARAEFRAALAIAACNAAADPANPVWQHELFVSHWHLGKLAEAMDDRPALMEHLHAARAQARHLMAQFSEWPNAKRMRDAAEGAARQLGLPEE